MCVAMTKKVSSACGGGLHLLYIVFAILQPLSEIIRGRSEII